MQTILLCVNARLLVTRARHRVLAVQKVFRDSGCRVEMVETTPFAAGPTLTRQKLDAISPDAVIVCGGDGTVFDALQCVAGTSIALGVVPFGTGNILAQNLHIRGSAASIAAALLHAESRPVRLGQVTLSGDGAHTYYFLSAAGTGPHAAVMKVASARSKRLVGKAAYWAAGILSWLSHPPQPFEAVVTSSAGATTAWCVCEALALRVEALNVWRPGGALEGSSLRLAMVPQTNRIGFAATISRAILMRSIAEVTSDDELERLVRSGRNTAAAGIFGGPIIYQDAVRIVCRPIKGQQQRRTPWVQADGELLESATTTIAMSDKSVHLLFPTPTVS